MLFEIYVNMQISQTGSFFRYKQSWTIGVRAGGIGGSIPQF